MADDKDVLLEMFKYYMGQALHHQVQRAATANIVLILAGATLGFNTLDEKLKGRTDVYAAVFLIALGLFGAIWSAKQHELYYNYMEIAQGYRNKLDDVFSQIDMKANDRQANDKAKARHPLLHRLRLWWLWAILYLIVAAIGILIFAYITWG